MRIAIDAMGGDHAPAEIVKGAVRAVSDLGTISKLILVGDNDAVRAELAKCDNVPSCIEVVHASEVIGMSDSPALAVRKKKDTSIGRAVDLVKHGEADAVVSAGNTGAIVVAVALKLRTLEGVERPAIAAVMPTQDRPVILLDAGANIECSAELLHQFAIMGSVYSNVVLGNDDPVVGVLSIGGEDIKGNELTKELFSILSKSKLNFRGNVEGHDLFKGETDVVVCDGFVGNVVLKTTESVARAISFWMKQEYKRNLKRIIGAVLLKGALKALKHRMDPESYGGAPLLGVNGVCIKTHGASSANAVFHAIRVAGNSVNNHLNEVIVEKIKKEGNIDVSQ